ncbi:hypothetical protein ES708_31015 [subsurface metagenome]
MAFPLVGGDAALGHEAAQVAVGADVVEAVVVDAEVGDVRRHGCDGVCAAQVQVARIAGGVELEDLGPELEALGPFGPAPGGVAALDSEDRRTLGSVVFLLDEVYLGGRQLPEGIQLGLEAGGGEVRIDFQHGISGLSLWHGVGTKVRVSGSVGRRPHG